METKKLPCPQRTNNLRNTAPFFHISSPRKLALPWAQYPSLENPARFFAVATPQIKKKKAPRHVGSLYALTGRECHVEKKTNSLWYGASRLLPQTAVLGGYAVGALNQLVHQTVHIFVVDGAQVTGQKIAKIPLALLENPTH